MDIKSILTTVFAYLKNNPLRFRFENSENIESVLEKLGNQIEGVSSAIKGVASTTITNGSVDLEETNALLGEVIQEIKKEKEPDEIKISLKIV